MFQNWMLFIFASSNKQVDRHLRKLDQELAKFKMELEADNAGITEILERRKYTWFFLRTSQSFCQFVNLQV